MKVSEMRGGYTTGSCATAGMKAALLVIQGQTPSSKVTIESPQHTYIEVPIQSVEKLGPTKAQATVIKDGGDDPDVTHGTEVITTVDIAQGQGLLFKAGYGVGHITKKGLSLPVGEPAINPGPRKMMRFVYDDICREAGQVTVTVSVPAGQELAKKTLNQTLGVEDGISIIGTTGLVKPMSEEAFKDSLVPQLKVMKESGYQTAVLVPGRIGEELAKNVLGIPVEQLAETSNFIGFMLEQAVDIGFKQIVVIGHIGKLIKVASGSFHTHNRMSDGRLESIAAYAGIAGASTKVIQEIMDCQTTESTFPLLEKAGLAQAVFQMVADRGAMRAKRYIANEAEVGIIIADLDGHILASDALAKRIGKEQGWHIPSM